MVHPFVSRRRGLEPVEYDHPLLEPILKDTYGVIVFQEQVLEVAHRFANMPLEVLDHVFSQSSLIVRGKLQVMGNWRGLVVSHAWPLQGILGGYEGHTQMGGGRDRMVKRTEGAATRDLFSG